MKFFLLKIDLWLKILYNKLLQQTFFQSIIYIYFFQYCISDHSIRLRGFLERQTGILAHHMIRWKPNSNEKLEN